MLIQVNVSLVRLNSFLLDDQLNKVEMKISANNSDHTLEDNGIEIQGGNYSWEPELGVLTLKGINMAKPEWGRKLQFAVELVLGNHHTPTCCSWRDPEDFRISE